MVPGANSEHPHLHLTPTDIDANNWVDRDLNTSIDFAANLLRPEEDDEPADTKGVKLFKIAKRSEEFLNGCFTHSVPNANRRTKRDKFGAPKTACPTLDKVIKSRLSANTKSSDKTLAKQQALLLDAVGPLSHILEEATNEQLSVKGTVDAVQTALRFLGNASMNINRERRKNTIKDLNPNLEDIAEDVQGFYPSTPWRRLY